MKSGRDTGAGKRPHAVATLVVSESDLKTVRIVYVKSAARYTKKWPAIQFYQKSHWINWQHFLRTRSGRVVNRTRTRQV